MTQAINRREFLKISGLAALALPFHAPISALQKPARDDRVLWLGRTVSSLRYYDIPSISGVELGYYITDSVVKVFETRIGDLKPAHNPIWLRTEGGWIHSASVQPVKDELSTPVLDVPVGGFLVEVCVPVTQAWVNNNGNQKRSYRYYYGTTHWVNLASTDSFGNVWYEIIDDLFGGYHYVLAQHMRRVLPEEVAPISPNVKDKYIIIKLADQKIYAFENGRVVFTARCSTGTFAGDTPTGEFKVERKQPSRHMAADEDRGNGFDLPGVPWVSFISWTGVSIHGTYWHNDYGEPRSHGCINLTPDAARWIYRWTLPSVPVEEDYVETSEGTRVIVV